MAKRLSRKRLFAINKLGEELVETAGAGISDSIGSSTRIRAGQEVVSEITLDLANGTAAASSFATAAGGPGTAAAVSVLGVSSSSGTHANAQVIQIDKDTVAGTKNSVVTSGELVCVETPAGGEDVIGLWTGTALSGANADLRNGGTQMILASAQVVGKDGTFDADSDLDNAYFYLVSSGSTAGAYTAGKFVLRFYGFDIFDDVS